MKELIAKLYRENEQTFLNNYFRLNAFHNENCDVASSTGKADCWFLYLLALQLKPKCIFEAGTFVGTTAKFLADAAMEYGGVVHTCDPKNQFLHSERHKDNLIFYNKGAKELVREFQKESRQIDFAFYDVDFLGPQHVLELLSLARDSSKFVFVAHDYTTAEGKMTKGTKNIEAVWDVLKHKEYQLLIPELQAYHKGHIVVDPEDGALIQYGINGCTAAIVPSSICDYPA